MKKFLYIFAALFVTTFALKADDIKKPTQTENQASEEIAKPSEEVSK